ncbi:YALIA101S02e19196g1_1 [Yarrowia lipolytica]|nr:YALIA101S02e19196g1_1 [Yarrowia lipolytica]
MQIFFESEFFGLINSTYQLTPLDKMLRASKAVRVSRSGLSESLRMLPPQVRSVSTQLVRNSGAKRKTATNTVAKQRPAKWGSRKPTPAQIEESKQQWLAAREKAKFGKLAAKLAEMKSARQQKQPDDGRQKVDPVTPEQRQLLDLIQGPLVTVQGDAKAHRNFLTSTLRRITPYVDEGGSSLIEKGRFDFITGRHVVKSQLEDLCNLDDAQKSLDPASHRIPLVFDDRGNALRLSVTGFFKLRNETRKGRYTLPLLQQINMPVRFESHRDLLLKVLEEEVQFQIEQEKIYQARLESLKSLSEGKEKLSEEDVARYKEIQQTHVSAQSEILRVLAKMGHIVACDNFDALLKPAILQHIITDGSETVHLLNLKDPLSRSIKINYNKFLSREGGQLDLPQAAVTDGTRVYAKYAKGVVVFPFYKLSGVQLIEILKKVVFAEFERIRTQYGIEEDELMAQLQIMADRGDNYLKFYPEKPISAVDEVTGLVLDETAGAAAEDDELKISFFKIHETEKEKYFSTKAAVRTDMGLPEEQESEFESVSTAVQNSTYEDVVSELERLRPESIVVARKTWDGISQTIEKNILVDDLRQYIRDWSKENKIPFPTTRLLKADLIHLLRDRVWKITLTDSVPNNVVSQTFKLSELQKIFLFKYHYQLVQLWVTRGAEVSFADEKNDEIVVSAPEKILRMVSVTLSQFGSRITCAKLDMTKSQLSNMTPELWKSLQESTETHIVHTDSDVLVYYLGNAQKKTKLLSRYIRAMSPQGHFSQSIIYQTNPESVDKSAFFPRAVSHEQPWYQRVIKKWARWREIHGSDYLSNTQEPKLSLVSSSGVSDLPSDLSLQNIISDTLITQLEALPSSIVTQDASQVVDSADQRQLSDRLAHKAILAGVVEPYDPAANNVAPTVYEKVSISATLGQLVHANKSTRDSRGSLDVSTIDPVRDVHFSGSVPFVNEKLRTMFPKSRPGAQDRYKMVLHCEPMSSTDAPPIQIEAVNMTRNEQMFKYPPPSIYAVTRQTNLLVSLPSINSDMMYSARSRQKLLPSANLLHAWEVFFSKASRQVQYPPEFEINVNGENTAYRCVSVVYARHDEYPVLSFDNTNEATAGVVMHRNIAGGDMCGVRNEVSVETIWRDYKVATEDESQLKSDSLLDDFVGNSLKFMDSLDAESVPL